MSSLFVIPVFLFYTSFYLVTLVGSQQEWTPDCSVTNHINAMSTHSYETSVFVEENETLFHLDRRHQPINLERSSTVRNIFNISRITFELSSECRQQIVSRDFKGIQFGNSKYVYINGRFRPFTGCKPIVDSVFEYELRNNLPLIETIPNYQLLAYGSITDDEISGFVSIGRNLTTNVIEETRSLIVNKTFRTNSIRNPSVPSSMSLLHIDPNNETITMLYVYDELLYTIVEIGYQEQISPSSVKTNWYSAAKLIGCPQNLCIDGQLEATNNVFGRFHLYSGLYVWKLDELAQDRPLPIPIRYQGQDVPSATFVAGSSANKVQVLLVDRVLIYDQKNYPFAQVF